MQEKRGFRGAVERAMRAAGVPSWYQLAKMAGIPMVTCYRYRDGRTIPGAVNAVKLARALNTSVEALVEVRR